MKIETNTPLAKHFIKKGKKICSDDLCYLSDETGNIVNIHASETDWEEIEYNTTFDYEIQEIINEDEDNDYDKYAIENIVEYQPINSDMVETIDERKRRKKEQKEKLKKEQKKLKEIENKAKIEAKKKIIEQKLQENLAYKDNKQIKNTGIFNQTKNTLKNEIKNNIWL